MENDAREIYESVLDAVKKELERLIPQYEEKVIENVVGRLNADESMYVIEQYERKINELEQKNKLLEKQISEIQSRLSQIPREIGCNVQKKNTDLAGNDRGNDRIDVKRYDIKYRGYKYNGWIYYANEEMGDFLYKVRVDGTDNQQLTDYSVSYRGFNIKNGKLYFDDASYKEHSIEI